MDTRRVFLKAAAAALACGVAGEKSIARVRDGKPVLVRDARVIRVRDRNGGATESYLKVTSESGLSGYAGPLLAEQVAAFPANLGALLAGRDAADPETLNFATLWARCHPGHPLQRYAEGKDPLTGATIWGTRRGSRWPQRGSVEGAGGRSTGQARGLPRHTCQAQQAAPPAASGL